MGLGPVPRNLMQVKVIHHAITTELKMIIDSGADESLMDWGLAETEPLIKPIKARALNGTELFIITHTTKLLELHIGQHKEHMSFYLFKSPSQALFLGHLWLRRHNPHVNWQSGVIRG